MLALYLCLVSLTIQKYLTVMDGRRRGWATDLKEQIDGGSNLLVIIPNAPNYLEEFAKVLGVDSDDLPTAVTRNKFFSLSPFIEPKDFDNMLAAQEEGNLLFFIEQLDLPDTQPPRVKPFLVYCPLRGIISQHDNQREARESCSDYQTAMFGLRMQHAPAVYKWRGNDWYNTEIC